MSADTIRTLGWISKPDIFISGEMPIMPAEAIGIETLVCLKLMEKTLFE